MYGIFITAYVLAKYVLHSLFFNH